jgi:exodeoxyribonuclease-3
MKIVTWNVNSVKARHDRLLAFLAREQPDVLCLQELKCVEDAFPFDAVKDAGYHAEVLGEKTYNGVAILSLKEPTDVIKGNPEYPEDSHSRLIQAHFDGVRVIGGYFPNGKTVGSDKYDYKIEWMGRLSRHLEKTASPDDALILCGDVNVAPEPRDVAVPDQWEAGVLCHQAARNALTTITDFGFTDLYRQVHPDENQYSWWDYRMLGFPKGNGLRIDLILGTPSMAARCTGFRIDRDERKGQKPSDHAPVIAEFD